VALWKCKSFSVGVEVEVGMSVRVKTTTSVAGLQITVPGGARPLESHWAGRAT